MYMYRVSFNENKHFNTFSEAVASLVPCRFIAMQDIAASCAATSNGGLSVFAKSTICTWPVLRPGKANSELLLLGHNTQRPVYNKSFY